MMIMTTILRIFSFVAGELKDTLCPSQGQNREEQEKKKKNTEIWLFLFFFFHRAVTCATSVSGGDATPEKRRQGEKRGVAASPRERREVSRPGGRNVKRRKMD